MMRLVNFHLGGSLYTVPMVAMAGGQANMLVLMGVCALLTHFVYENLADVAVNRRDGSLCRIVRRVLGKPAAIVLRGLIVLNAFGVVVAYMQATSDVYHSIVVEDASPTAHLYFLAIVVVGCAAVPVLEYKFSDVADWGSLVANLALLVLLGALAWLPRHDLTGGSRITATEPLPFLQLLVRYGPSLVFAFSSAEYVLLACGVCDMDGVMLPQVDVHGQVRRVGASSLLLSLALYVGVGCGGVRAFGPDVHDDILKNFALKGSDNELLSIAVLSTNAVSLLLSLPVFAEALLLYLRELMQDVLPEAAWASLEGAALARHLVNPTKPFTGCSWIVPLAAAMAYKVAGLLSIINLMSACTDYAFMFVFPGLAWCATYPWRVSPLRWLASFALVAAALVMGYWSFVEALRSG